MEKKFSELRLINVNDHIEKKNGLSYLSWAWAVDKLMELDETATWEYLEEKKYGDTLMVFCKVTAFGRSKTAHLPVMDYKNKAIPNPDAFQVNTAMQRCLAKGIALHGIGLYIYAGEDLPGTEGLTEDQKSELRAGLTLDDPKQTETLSEKAKNHIKVLSTIMHQKDGSMELKDWMKNIGSTYFGAETSAKLNALTTEKLTEGIEKISVKIKEMQ